jgi:hydroxyethylthiazole kinase
MPKSASDSDATSAWEIWRDVERIRAEAPLVHNITNYVVMNTTANALLALGASPVMAHAPEEVKEMVGLARALVLNIGTLSSAWINAMLMAGREANRKGIPIVVDPVGSGATRLRTETALHLVQELHPAIVRGNASEIRSLVLGGPATRGVDSTHGSEEVLESALALAEREQCVVVVSGAVDIIVSGTSVIRILNGHPMMARVTGLGCTATALAGAFSAINATPLRAAAHAMAVMGVAGEIAVERAAGPGSLQMHFLDALYSLRAESLEPRLKMQAG